MESTMSEKPWFSRLRGFARCTHTAIANPSADNTTTRALWRPSRLCGIPFAILQGGPAVEVGSLVELSQEIHRAQQHTADIRSHVQRRDTLTERATLLQHEPEDSTSRATASHEGHRILLVPMLAVARKVVAQAHDAGTLEQNRVDLAQR